MTSQGRGRTSDGVLTPEQIGRMRAAADLVTKVHAELGPMVQPGIDTLSLDKVAEQLISDHGATPAFKGYRMYGADTPFPGTLCTSRNEVVVHGIPSQELRVEEGDILSIDVGVELDGVFGDCASTYAVGKIDQETQRLLDVTLESLYEAIDAIEPNGWVYDVSRAVQRRVEADGFGVVRELVGHGIGDRLHMDPAVPNFMPSPFMRHQFKNARLRPGSVICIEPMVNMGTPKVVTLDDEWTVVSRDGSRSAHFEHMVLITEEGPEVLTGHLPVPERSGVESSGE